MATKNRIILALISGAAIAFAGYSLGYRAEAKRSPVADLTLPGYSQQKVVYHITDSDGLLHRNYSLHVLQSAQNHVNAVGKDKLDLRIVLQGDGLDLLKEAAGDRAMSERVDKLKAQGVRFLVCRNTLVGRGLDPADLYDVKTADIVGAAVAEVSALQAQGFVYVKP